MAAASAPAREMKAMSRIFDDIRQVGYVTPDLGKALDFMVTRAGIGPWFVLDKVPIRSCAYRGNPVELEISVALANSGTLQLELIQQTSPEPSIYTEWLETCPQGDVPQHFSSWSSRYDEVHASALALGYDAVQEGRSGFGRFVYFQNPANPAFTYEVTEMTPARRSVFGQIAEAARGWDGRDPVRIGWPQPVDLDLSP